MGAPLYKFKDNVTGDIPFKFIRHKDEQLVQPLHMHDYFQVAYVMRGVCTHDFCNRLLTVGKGDIFIIPPWVEHRLNSLENKDCELILLDFIPAFIGDQFKPFSQSIYHHLLHYKDVKSPSQWLQPWLHISQEKQLLVEQLLQDIADEFENMEEGYTFSIQINLIKLLLLIDREFRRDEVSLQYPRKHRQHQQQLNEVIRYVYNNYDREILLEQASDIAHMTPSYFSHLFKKETGQTFVEFLHEVRIERAMALIRQNELTVTQICFQIGFSNLSHFIRTFKRRIGLTPTDYKRSLFIS